MSITRHRQRKSSHVVDYSSFPREILNSYLGYRKDVSKLRKISNYKSLEAAERVAKSKRQLTWKLEKLHAKPKLIWARTQPTDPKYTRGLVQLCIKFDTQQVCGRKGVERGGGRDT